MSQSQARPAGWGLIYAGEAERTTSKGLYGGSRWGIKGMSLAFECHWVKFGGKDMAYLITLICLGHCSKPICGDVEAAGK